MVINPIRAGGRAGLIGLSDCPGKGDNSADSAARRKVLERDILVVKGWHPQALVSALEDEDLKTLRVENVGAAATRAGMWWFRLPLKQDAVPDKRFWNAWPHAAPALLDILRHGQRVVLHSGEGRSRAALVACCLLIELGLQPDVAIAALQDSAGDKLLTPAQELFVREYLPRFSEHTRLRSPEPPRR